MTAQGQLIASQGQLMTAQGQLIAGQGQEIGSIGQRVTTLENAWQDTNIDVNCGAGQTVAAARRTAQLSMWAAVPTTSRSPNSP